jgi:hypothetical protein
VVVSYRGFWPPTEARTIATPLLVANPKKNRRSHPPISGGSFYAASQHRSSRTRKGVSGFLILFRNAGLTFRADLIRVGRDI